MSKTLRYFSTFSGIGGFELGIHRAFDVQTQRRGEKTTARSNEAGEGLHTISGERASTPQHTDNEHTDRSIDEGQLNCVGFSEIDKYAASVYEHNFPGAKNYGDITKINAEELPDFDLLVGGFPCQAFSVAGKRKGFDDTRGTLFFDLARILRAKQPRLFVFENVKGLLSHDNGNTFKTIVQALDELGYDLQWQVLNSKNHGVPQNRERIYIVGHLRGTGRPQVFPLGLSANKDNDRVNGTGITARPVYKDGKRELEWSRTSISNTLKAVGQTDTSTTFVAPRVVAQRGRYNSEGKIEQQIEPRPDDVSNTLTAVQKDNMVYEDFKIRKLTPTECERLQGFPDNWTAMSTNGKVSDTQRYKMCGNAVTTNVVQAVMEKLL